MEQLPTMYWLPKLHKNPYGSRFIAASNKCSTMPLLGLLTTILKEYCAGIFRNTGVNCFWVINNAQLVLQSMHALNDTSAARTLDIVYKHTTSFLEEQYETLHRRCL